MELILKQLVGGGVAIISIAFLLNLIYHYIKVCKQIKKLKGEQNEQS